MYRGETHGYIIAVLCAKSYKRDEYANEKIIFTFNDLPEIVVQL